MEFDRRIGKNILFCVLVDRPFGKNIIDCVQQFSGRTVILRQQVFITFFSHKIPRDAVGCRIPAAEAVNRLFRIAYEKENVTGFPRTEYLSEYLELHRIGILKLIDDRRMILFPDQIAQLTVFFLHGVQHILQQIIEGQEILLQLQFAEPFHGQECGMMRNRQLVVLAQAKQFRT